MLKIKIKCDNAFDTCNALLNDCEVKAQIFRMKRK